MKRKRIKPAKALFSFIGLLLKTKSMFRKIQQSNPLNLVLVSLLLFSISSCSKEPIGPPDEETSNEGKQLISFTIDGFSQDLLPFTNKMQSSALSASANRTFNSNSILATGTQSSDIRDFINTIEIKVYEGSTLVDSIRQYTDDPNFGKHAKYYNVKTPHSLYVVGAMLENNGDIIMRKHTPNGGAADVHLKILPDPVDAFFIYKAYHFKQEPQHENLKLKRYVGRVEIHLDELIPSEAARIDIAIQNTAEYFLPHHQRGYYLNPVAELDHSPHHTFKRIFIKPEDIGRTDYSLSAYFVLKNELGSAPDTSKIILQAYREDGSLIREREIPNISIQANKRTKLTGKLFTIPNIDFEMEVENDWDAEVPEYEF